MITSSKIVICLLGIWIELILVFPAMANESPLYLIAEHGRWGLIDQTGTIVLPPKFDTIASYDNGWANDSALNMELPDGVGTDLALSLARPITSKVIPVRIGSEVGFADRNGSVFGLGTFDRFGIGFREGMIDIWNGEKVGFADENGMPIIPFQFDATTGFQGGFAFAKKAGLWGVIDKTGTFVKEPVWDEVNFSTTDLVSVRQADRWGVVDRTGASVVPLKFDIVIGSPTEDRTPVEQDGKIFYVKTDGSGEKAFDLSCPQDAKLQAYPFFASVALFKCGNSYGLVDKFGGLVLPPTYSNIHTFADQRSIVSLEKKQGIVDEKANFVVPLTKEMTFWSYTEGLAGFHRKKTGTNGFLDRDGTIVFESDANYGHVKEGLIVAQVKVNSRWKKGYIDTSGNVVIAPRFWQAEAFNGPLAYVGQPVSKNAKESGYINRKGEVVWRRTFTGYIWNRRQIDETGIRR